MCFDRCSLESSVAILIRCASPPESVVADWPEGQVPEPQVVQHVDLLAHGRFVREERHAFLHRHVEHVGDGLTAQGDLQRLGAEARALADAAGHFDVRHEVELGGDHALALALLAPAALDVEAEASCLVAAFDGNRGSR